MPASKTASTWALEKGLFIDERLKRLGIRHGVTARTLGDMQHADRRRAALAGAGVVTEAHFLKQVHGTVIIDVPAASAPEAGAAADGWITASPKTALGVYAADCLPLFVWERRGRAAGVFHSGWRGTALGMPGKAVAAFSQRYGIEPRDLQAAVGPHIGPCCYKVGSDLEGRFRAESFSRDAGVLRLDLGAEARSQLLSAGLAEEDVSVSDACTSCQTQLLFSFRRDKTGSRMMAFLWIDR
ncbi:MAG: peptidoglycan editing factor PgeF [Elusimicrobiota bacterium]